MAICLFINFEDEVIAINEEPNDYSEKVLLDHSIGMTI